MCTLISFIRWLRGSLFHQSVRSVSFVNLVIFSLFFFLWRSHYIIKRGLSTSSQFPLALSLFVCIHLYLNFSFFSFTSSFVFRAQLARVLFRRLHECWPLSGTWLSSRTSRQFKCDPAKPPDHPWNKRYDLFGISLCFCSKFGMPFPSFSCITSPSSGGREWHPAVGGICEGWMSISSTRSSLEASPFISRRG